MNIKKEYRFTKQEFANAAWGFKKNAFPLFYLINIFVDRLLEWKINKDFVEYEKENVSTIFELNDKSVSITNVLMSRPHEIIVDNELKVFEHSETIFFKRGFKAIATPKRVFNNEELNYILNLNK